MSGAMRDFREVIREEMLMRGKILKVLEGGAKTVPKIAEEIGYPAHEVMFWVMGMRKYGQVAEMKETTDDGFYQYEAVKGEGEGKDGTC